MIELGQTIRVNKSDAEHGGFEGTVEDIFEAGGKQVCSIKSLEGFWFCVDAENVRVLETCSGATASRVGDDQREQSLLDSRSA